MSIARPCRCRLLRATPPLAAASFALVVRRAIAGDHVERFGGVEHLAQRGEVVEQRPVDRHDVVGPVIAQQVVDRGERVVQVLPALAIDHVQSLAGVGVAEGEPPMAGRGRGGRRARARDAGLPGPVEANAPRAIGAMPAAAASEARSIRRRACSGRLARPRRGGEIAREGRVGHENGVFEAFRHLCSGGSLERWASRKIPSPAESAPRGQREPRSASRARTLTSRATPSWSRSATRTLPQSMRSDKPCRSARARSDSAVGGERR